MSLFNLDPFSTLSADTLFASEFAPKRFKACPPTWEVWISSVDTHGHLNHYELRGGRDEDGNLRVDEPSLPISCAGGYDNAVRVMVQYLSQYVIYHTEMTPDVNGNTRFCEACNGVPEGGNASDYALPDFLDYYTTFAEGGRDDQNNIISCHADYPFSELRWVDYPNAGYMCQATIRDYLNYNIKQRFSEEDYDAACEGCTIGDIIEELIGGGDGGTGTWWEDYDPNAPVDCETGEWSKWGKCIEGRQKRSKKVLKWNKNEGAECDEQRAAEKVNGVWSIVDIRSCTDCEVTGWSAWSACVAGTQKRTKKDMGETEEEEYGCAILEEKRNCTTDSPNTSTETTTETVPMWLILAAAGAIGLNFMG